LNREKKSALVEQFVEDLDQAKAVMLVNPIGLTVAQSVALREQLRDKESHMIVSKNTLFRRAGENNDLGLLEEHFKGPNALVFASGDPVACAKVLVDYAKDNPKLEIKAGLLSGKVVDAAGITDLARLPSREVLLAQMAATFQAPITGLARAMDSLLRGLPNAMQALISKKEAEA